LFAVSLVLFLSAIFLFLKKRAFMGPIVFIAVGVLFQFSSSGLEFLISSGVLFDEDFDLVMTTLAWTSLVFWTGMLFHAAGLLYVSSIIKERATKNTSRPDI